MENEQISAKLDALQQKVDVIALSVARIRNYLFWTFIVTIVLVVLPLIGLVFAIPMFMQNYVGTLDSLSGLM